MKFVNERLAKWRTLSLENTYIINEKQCLFFFYRQLPIWIIPPPFLQLHKTVLSPTLYVFFEKSQHPLPSLPQPPPVKKGGHLMRFLPKVRFRCFILSNDSYRKRNSLDTRAVFIEFSDVNNSGVVVY